MGVQFTPLKTHRLDLSILSTSRTKRWNGTLESLAADYLKGVAERMEAYGDRVQFELPGHGKHPIYQVIGRSERKMGFDGKHLLLRLNDSGNVAETLSAEFTLEAVREAIAGKRGSRARSAASPSAGNGATPVRRRAAAAPAVVDTVEQEKYAYYRANRDSLPEDIAQHAAEISALMRAGKSAEEAFQQIIAQHY
jgi:hypothetical protein